MSGPHPDVVAVDAVLTAAGARGRVRVRADKDLVHRATGTPAEVA